MKFDKYLPSHQLKPYIRYFVVSENDMEMQYKVFPSSGLVIGFQYRGQLTIIENNKESSLEPSGITGISDTFKIFKNSAGIGTVLIYFTEIGFTSFATNPAHELFNLSISLEDVFDKEKTREVEEKLHCATSDLQRIYVIEQFLLSQLKDHQTDKLVVEAVKLIRESNGTIRIRELNEKLCISQSPLEKRFRKIVGTTPKKFASIVRFNTILDNFTNKVLTEETSTANSYFDQAHFIKDFKHFTGQTPENFKRFM